MKETDVPQTILHEAPRFRVVELTQTARDGTELKRQVVMHPGAVVILPLVDEDHVCLIRNQRVAVGKTLVELPAGTLDRDEPPSETARRELKEETGYEAREWLELPGFFMSPGILNERMHVFAAKQLTAGAPQLEEGEDIENLIVSWEVAMEMVDRGEIEDAKTLCALLAWDRRKGKKATASEG